AQEWDPMLGELEEHDVDHYDALGLLAEHAVQSVGRLVDQGLRVVRERVEILERHVPPIPDRVERLDNRWPVRGAVEQRPEALKTMIGAFLAELLEMDVLDPLAEDRNPIFWILKKHDVAAIEVDPDVVGAEAVDERDHIGGAQQVAVEEDVLDVEADVQFLRQGE